MLKYIKNLNEKSWQILGVVFLCLTGCGLAVVCFVQGILGIGLAQNYDLGETWYGEVYETKAVASDEDEVWGNVVLRLTDFTTLPEAVVLLNGEPVKKFVEQEVTVRVVSGDVLSVDTSAYDAPVAVRIKSVSSVIDTRELREITVIRSGSAVLGKILLK
ncbi:MAG: hypothetical protein ACOX7J_03855 [Bacillota bacterium]